MPKLQVLVDPKNASAEEIAASVQTLSRDDDAEVIILQQDQPAAPLLHAEDAVLVTTAKVVFARGALRRLVDAAGQPGRCVTRVYVPNLTGKGRVAVWSADWVRDRGLSALDLRSAGLRFDRENLPSDDPNVRHWVRADEIGVAELYQVGGDVDAWAKAEGRRIRVRELYAAVRARAGVLRRRRVLRNQRNRLPQYQRPL